MGVLHRDPEPTAATLARWFETQQGVASPSITNVSIPEATGWSNETIFFDATWLDASAVRSRALVARVAPSEHRVFPDDTFARQYAVMRALASHSDVPIPEVHWLETDRVWFGQPFW